MDKHNVFIISKVSVDVTDKTALLAREKAMAQGQIQAWKALLNRLTLSQEAIILSDLSVEMLDNLVQGYEVLRERTSSVRYLADLAVTFNSEKVRRLFSRSGVSFTVTRSRPVLIIPIFYTEGAKVLWDHNNPWRDAWQNLPARDGLLPLIVPNGDLADIRDLTAVQAGRGDRRSLDLVAERYGARDVVVASASLMFDVRDNLPVLEIAMAYYSDYKVEEAVVDSVKGAEKDDLTQLLDLGVSRVVETLSNDWKRSNLVVPGVETRISAIVPIKDFRSWLSMQNRLKQIGIVRQIGLRNLSKKRAFLDLWVQGDVSQLRNALRQSDMELHEGKQKFVLIERNQSIPMEYLQISPEGENNFPLEGGFRKLPIISNIEGVSVAPIKK